ncbi:alpha/beta hydrolase family protein [Gordonia neofelifaecis]|uniref:Lipase n=1 Tax=Gordonia neofelifaecis NRRL B-59395 TaxID=644548 RepID=F1YLB2_9ACTN|nr:lipase family protein [Gordonia neofelifaecis]EGD54572.1 lipase [Gordonia neofelifaecis NRRL B-59395]
MTSTRWTVSRIGAAAAAFLVLLAGLALIPATATAAPAGSVIDVVARPAGWRGLENGRALDYWTQDPEGKPVPTSGALFVPAGTAPKGGWPVVAYTHGTSGYGPGCGGQSGADAKANRYITRLVDSGYAVVATDYVGLGRFDTGVHPYLNIRSEATATIDMLRAARSVEPSLSNRWAVTGDSQGGQAALATAHLQRSYGPRTDFRGTVSLDPESDVEKIMPFLGPYIPSLPAPLNGTYNFLLAILAGLRQADPAVNVNSYLTPLGKSLVDQVGQTCGGPKVDPNLAFGSLLSRPLGTQPMSSALMRYMAVPVSGYDAPILLLLNTLDTTVPSPLHAKLAADFALNGVDYRMVIGNGSHTDMDAAQWAAFDQFFAAHLK